MDGDEFTSVIIFFSKKIKDFMYNNKKAVDKKYTKTFIGYGKGMVPIFKYDPEE